MPNDIDQQILKELQKIREESPNGDIKEIKDNLCNLSDTVQELKNIIVDPESGLIVRTNENSDFIDNNKKEIEKIPKLENWQNNINKAALALGGPLIGGLIWLAKYVVDNGLI